MKEAMSIGIIGGADGPTAVFITGPFPWEIILLGAICLALCVYFYRKKK